MHSVTLILLQVLATGSLAQITWDTAFTTATTAPTGTSLDLTPKRAVEGALVDDPYRCRNGGDLYCCDSISGRDNPCKNKKTARAQSECPYMACCLTNGHGYYCLDPPSSGSSSYSPEPSPSSSSSPPYTYPSPDPNPSSSTSDWAPLPPSTSDWAPAPTPATDYPSSSSSSSSEPSYYISEAPPAYLSEAPASYLSQAPASYISEAPPADHIPTLSVMQTFTFVTKRMPSAESKE